MRNQLVFVTALLASSALAGCISAFSDDQVFDQKTGGTSGTGGTTGTGGTGGTGGTVGPAASSGLAVERPVRPVVLAPLG